MWFGTQDGLNKYDGYRFTVYQTVPGDPRSLSNNHVNVVFEDREGFIWIGTDGGGLNRFDPLTETFYRYPSAADDLRYLNNPFINAVCQGPDGSIWVGTMGGGICRIKRTPDPTSPFGYREQLYHYRNIPAEPTSLPGNRVLALCFDQDGTLWIGTRNMGLVHLNPENGVFTRYSYRGNTGSGVNYQTVSVIYEDHAGYLWIGTSGGGLYRLDRKSNHLTRYLTTNPSGNIIQAIFEDRAHRLWIGTLRGGLALLEPTGNGLITYKKDPDNPFSLSHDTVTSIYEDRSGMMWFGTAGGGLNKYNRSYNFAHFKKVPNNENTLTDNLITAILEDRSGILWIGTYGKGLNRLDRKTNTYTHLRGNLANRDQLGSDFINVLFEDRQGEMWIGTDFGGLVKYDRDAGTFKRYWALNPRSGRLNDRDVRALFEDSTGVLWVGTYNNGLNKYNRTDDTFSYYKHEPGKTNSLSDNCIAYIYEAPGEPGVLWIGTLNGGVNRFDLRTSAITRFRATPDQQAGLSNDTITCIHEDRARNLWVSTYGGGLNRLDRFSNGDVRFHRFTKKDGLPDNSIYGILEDSKGRLWLSTNNGLSRFDPPTAAFKNYGVEDGVQGKEFNGGAFFKSSGGEMFFGGINGFNAFYPLDIIDNTFIPPVVITDFSLMNKPIKIGPDSLLKQSVMFTESVSLSHEQHVVSFQFAALDYTIPSKNKYRYRLDGFDHDWVETDSGHRFASYTNLDPGHYIFRVTGSNNDGIWNDVGTALKIIIRPPFWRTWWFALLMMVVVAALTLLGYMRRLRSVRLQTELQTAHNAQMSIMPQCDPVIPGYEISGACVPANEVGGDFFDYIWLKGERKKLGIVVGDVSGKAMKSAMTAVLTSGMIYLEAGHADSIETVMHHVNKPLCLKTDKKAFVALCLAALDVSARSLAFSNAGLNDPLLKSDGNVARMKGCGQRLPLGINCNSDYRARSIALQPGDVVVFHTDGIPESVNSSNQFYTEEALEALLTNMDTHTLSACQIKESIVRDAQLFSRGMPQHDDITVVVLKVL